MIDNSVLLALAASLSWVGGLFFIYCYGAARTKKNGGFICYQRAFGYFSSLATIK